MAGALSYDASKLQVLTSKTVGFESQAGERIGAVHKPSVHFNEATVQAHKSSPQTLISAADVGHKQHRAPTKHASMLNLGSVGLSKSAIMPSVGDISTPQYVPSSISSPKDTQPELPQTQAKAKSVSRTISTYFKNLFRKTDNDGNDSASSSVAPSRQDSMLSVKSSAKSSTAAIENEVAAAMKRAASISGRQHAPSTLLAVSRDLPPKMQRPVWNLRDYAVVDKMYTGYASNVYKAFCKYSGETVCLKSYCLSNLCELNRFQIFREVKLHSGLSHEHVIKLYGAFQQADQVVLVQEYAEAGDLFSLLQRFGGRLPERTAVELVMYPFLCVINYLHTNGIAHRDIKPENILFTGDMRLKLCDFGLAINMREERAVTRAGTLEYMAPEVLNCPFKNKPDENKENSRLHYSFHVDTWAAGVLTYELLVGIPPFSDKQRNMVEDKIRLDMPKFPSKMSELAQNFITRALEKNPIERPTVLDMINHRWIRTHRRSSSVRQLQPIQPQKSSSGMSMSTHMEQDEEDHVTSPPAAKPLQNYALPGSMMTEDVVTQQQQEYVPSSRNSLKPALTRTTSHKS